MAAKGSLDEEKRQGSFYYWMVTRKSPAGYDSRPPPCELCAEHVLESGHVITVSLPGVPAPKRRKISSVHLEEKPSQGWKITEALKKNAKHKLVQAEKKEVKKDEAEKKRKGGQKTAGKKVDKKKKDQTDDKKEEDQKDDKKSDE